MTEPCFKSPLYRLLAVLLDYPGPHFGEILEEASAFLLSAQGPPSPCAEEICETVAWMGGQSLLELQKRYVETFDLSPAHSLNLTSHLLDEEDRRRGDALVALVRHYAATGMRLKAGELPDYLPAVLEYAATLEEKDAVAFLAMAEGALEALEHRLEAADSRYASLVRAARGPARAESRLPAATGVEP